MKSFFLALCVVLSAAQVQIFSNFTQQNAPDSNGHYTPVEQFLLVENTLPFSQSNSVYSVTFQVCVRFSIGEFAIVTYPLTKGSSTFYSYVGAVAPGGVNGTAGFYITGLAGTYTITASVFYKLNGAQYSVAKDFSFTISPAGTPPASREVEAVAEDNTAVAVNGNVARNSDVSCSSCSFVGVVNQPTWNAFQFQANVNLYSISYTCVTADPNTAIAMVSGPNAVGNGKIGTMSFTLSGAVVESNYLNITLTYKRGTPSGTLTTWGSTYQFAITNSGGKREVELLDFNAAEQFNKEIAVQAVSAQQNTASQPKTISIEYAFGAAVAGIALVAAVAVIAVIAVFRSKKISSTQVA